MGVTGRGFVPPEPERICKFEVEACEDTNDDDQDPHQQIAHPAGSRRRQKTGEHNSNPTKQFLTVRPR
jgi:hypothetical protein